MARALRATLRWSSATSSAVTAKSSSGVTMELPSRHPGRAVSAMRTVLPGNPGCHTTLRDRSSWPTALGRRPSRTIRAVPFHEHEGGIVSELVGLIVEHGVHESPRDLLGLELIGG